MSWRKPFFNQFYYQLFLWSVKGKDTPRNKTVKRSFSKNLRKLLNCLFFFSPSFFLSPGYEGVSEFFTDLLNHIAAVLQGQVPEVTQLNRSKLLAEQSGGIMDERICCASTGCLSVMGKDSSWIVDSETNSSVKLQHQRLGCNSAVSPSFQQHCVATLATKASSQ